MSNELYKELRNVSDFDETIVKAYRDLGVNKAQSKEIHFIVKELTRSLMNRDGIGDDDKFDGYTLGQYMLGAMLVGMATKDSIMDAISDIKDTDVDYELSEDEIVEDVN